MEFFVDFGSGVGNASYPVVSSNWVPFTGFFSFLLLFYCLLLFLLIRLPHFLLGYSFGIVDLGIIVTKMRDYISSHGGSRLAMHYFGLSGRSDFPDVLANSYLDTNEFDRWHKSLSFKYREVRKRKGFNHPDCPFCIRVAFDRSVGAYVVKRCRSSHTCHGVNLSSIVGHVRYESDYLFMRGVIWLTLVKLVTSVYSLRLRFVVCSPIKHTIQT